jgi:hypothetical protein
VDISGPALVRLLKEEYGTADEDADWVFSSPVAAVGGRGMVSRRASAPSSAPPARHSLMAGDGGSDRVPTPMLPHVFTGASGDTPVEGHVTVPLPLVRGSSVGVSAAAGDVVETRHGTVPGHGDVMFVVDGRHVRLHRAILAARSEYFRNMFSNGFHESSAAVITLSDITYPVFIALIRFLYTDQLPPPCAEALVLPLLQQSQKMGLTRLSCLCQRQLEARLDPQNAAAMLEAADTHHALPLRASCLRYILQNFSQVSRTHSFLVVRTLGVVCLLWFRHVVVVVGS